MTQDIAVYSLRRSLCWGRRRKPNKRDSLLHGAMIAPPEGTHRSSASTALAIDTTGKGSGIRKVKMT